MWLVASTLCVLVTLWASGFCHTLLTVGPCVVNREKATFDCSRRNLKSVPGGIWPNVTKLDLSRNHLNLAHTKALKKLQHFDHLITLNLSGNYLPLLGKQHFYPLPSLQILDLSKCKVAAVETEALLSFPRLQKLFLRNNYLQSPLSDELHHHGWFELVDLSTNPQSNERFEKVKKRRLRVHKQKAQERRSDGDVLNMIIQSQVHRKLLTETILDYTVANRSNQTTDSENSGKSASGGWKPLVAVLVIAIAISILIAVGAKCKLVHRYLASYRHSRLSETDTSSHCDPAGFEVGFSTRAHADPPTRSHTDRASQAGSEVEEDDDGFIEDNYIQASERERAEREAVWEEEEDEEEEMEFTIG